MRQARGKKTALKKKGSIGVDELLEPLISLGIAKSKEEIQLLIKTVDTDNSRRIEFKEFLQIIKNQNKETNSSGGYGLIEFFKGSVSSISFLAFQ